MSDPNTKSESATACLSCKRPLFGCVKFCPFCGAAQNLSSSTHSSTPPHVAQFKQEEANEPPKKINPPKQTAAHAAGVDAILTPAASAAVPPRDSAPFRGEAEHLESEAEPSKPKAEASSKIQKPAAPSPLAPQSAPPVPTPGPHPKSGGRLKWLVSLIFLGAVFGGWQFFGSSMEPDACQQALEGADAAMQNKQYAQAKMLAMGSLAHCSRDLQVKARTLIQAAELAMAEQAKCIQALELAGRQIADGHLRQAQRTLDAQSGSCPSSPEFVAKKADITRSMVFAEDKVKEAQAQLDNGQIGAARSLLEQAERRDRNNERIAQVRAKIAQAEWDANRIASAAAEDRAAREKAAQVPLQLPSSSPVRAGPAPAPPRVVPEVNSSNDARRQVECAVLVRAGERALASHSYDVAIENAQMAIKAVADCQGARALLDEARKQKRFFQEHGVIIN